MIDINVIGAALLLQGTQALLQKSSGQFLVLSSAVGQFSQIANIPMPLAAYGSTKAAVNFLIARAHAEKE